MKEWSNKRKVKRKDGKEIMTKKEKKKIKEQT
jgi:hypothetical protein